MRIGIDARFWHSMHAGMSQYTKGLVKGLAKIDRTNDYFIILRKRDLDEWDVGAPNFHPVVYDIPHYSFSEQLVLPWKLLALNLDLMHFTNFNFPLVYPKKFTVTIHDLAYYFFPGRRLKGRIFKWGYYLTMWAAVHRAAKVIAITKYVAGDVAKSFRVDRKKIVVVYEGVDPDRFLNRNISRERVEALKRQLGIKWPLLFYVANWRVHKNHATLLQGFEVLRNRGIKAQLLLGGKPTEETLSLINRHPYEKDIIVVGFIDDKELANYYALADVYVFPSLYEGFGLPLVEAQYMGVPVAAAKATTLPEVGEDSVLYFSPLDAEDLALVVSNILRSKKTQASLRQRGFRNLKRFNWGKAGQETLKVFKEVAHGRRSRQS